MAMSSKKRSTYPLCGAMTKRGVKCRAFAGQGTDHRGSGRCKYHGGSTPSHRQSAVVQEAQTRMVKLGQPLDIAPGEALLMMLRLASGHVAWLRETIATTEDLGTHEGRVLTALYSEERDRVAKVARSCLDAGVAERQVRLAEQYGDVIAEYTRALLNDLVLSEDQQKAAPEVVRRALGKLAAIESGPALPARARA